MKTTINTSIGRPLLRSSFILIALALGSLALAERVQAVNPPPDGGYPGQNTAEGQNALLHLAGGTYNTALGWASLGFNVTGNYNTGIGAATLLNNTAAENTATGAGALLSNTVGDSNTANGAFALLTNTVGQFNTAIGGRALQSNTNGAANTATGSFALASNHSGGANTATGFSALLSNIDGISNTASGYQALYNHTSGDNNTADGSQALLNDTIGHDNTAIGFRALTSNSTGAGNTANGVNALASNIDGFTNTASGVQALFGNTTGAGNTANGYAALGSNTIGDLNTASGYLAGVNITGGGNVCIGANVFGLSGENNTIRIANNLPSGAGESACFVGGISGQTAADGIAVFINSSGKLGTLTSSARFKTEIKPMGAASEAILALKPVAFRYKKPIDPQGIPQFGLVAEDVEAVNPDLVVRDKEGKVSTVRYEAINAMLLNEFLKEHKKVEEQQATITQLKKDFRATVADLTARLKEQDSKIEKVSAQMELSKRSPQTVLNNQ
jgi:Chaperone of endosialidase